MVSPFPLLSLMINYIPSKRTPVGKPTYNAIRNQGLTTFSYFSLGNMFESIQSTIHMNILNNCGIKPRNPRLDIHCWFHLLNGERFNDRFSDQSYPHESVENSLWSRTKVELRSFRTSLLYRLSVGLSIKNKYGSVLTSFLWYQGRPRPVPPMQGMIVSKLFFISYLMMNLRAIIRNVDFLLTSM